MLSFAQCALFCVLCFLFQGVFSHGFGQWSLIFRDPELPFAAFTTPSAADASASVTGDGAARQSQSQPQSSLPAAASGDGGAEQAEALRRNKMVPRRLQYLEKALGKQLRKKDAGVRLSRREGKGVICVEHKKSWC